MDAELEQIKPGDKVWVGSINHSRLRIQPVARLTPTLIILDGHYTGGAKSDLNRYRRDGGWQVNAGASRYQITGVATPEEYERWSAEQERKAEAERERQRKVREREAKRAGLNDLFNSERVYVQDTERNLAGEWQVCIYASEDDVRRIAEAVRDILAR